MHYHHYYTRKHEKLVHAQKTELCLPSSQWMRARWGFRRSGRRWEMVREPNYLDELPQHLVHEILLKLDVESLCCIAPASRALYISASQALASFSTIDFLDFAPDAAILSCILDGNVACTSLSLDCHRLNQSAINILAKEQLEELILLRCSLPSSLLLSAIGRNCMKLRVLRLDLLRSIEPDPSDKFEEHFVAMLKRCSHLEYLSLKFLELNDHFIDLGTIIGSLPSTIKWLQLRPTFEENIEHFFHHNCNYGLESLSLTMDTITDDLIRTLTTRLPLLSKIDLEDKPTCSPEVPHDLSNNGLQLLGFCTHLTHLSLVRRREYNNATFKMVNDFGIFLLVEGCKNLEAIKLGGFSRVTDAGFVSILHSCQRLKNFEVINAFYLSDLALHGLSESACSLTVVRLTSCSLLTSGCAESLSFCKCLEVLDLGGCRSMADQGLKSVACLTRLSTLNLAGADITDSGLMALGRGSAPIKSLSIRNCKRVTDRGVAFMFFNGGVISRTLLALDLGFMPGISDKAVAIITEAGAGIVDLCLRSCYYVTDSSIEIVVASGAYDHLKNPLRRLDLCGCSGLTVRSAEMLLNLHCLHWIGLGATCLSKSDMSRSRKRLSICFSGCELGCHDECPDLMGDY